MLLPRLVDCSADYLYKTNNPQACQLYIINYEFVQKRNETEALSAYNQNVLHLQMRRHDLTLPVTKYCR